MENETVMMASAMLALRGVAGMVVDGTSDPV